MKILASVYGFLTSWIGALLLVFVLIFFVAQGFIIPSRSMVGTLYEGDMMLVKKFAYGVPIPKIPWIELPIFPDLRGDRHLIPGERPKRGDIVVFNPPGDDKTYYVKRNFATGGDKVVFARDGMYLRPVEGDAYIKAKFDGYDTKSFFGEVYVKEPYSKEFIGIHYGEKGVVPPYNSYVSMKSRAALYGFNNSSVGSGGIAMAQRISSGEEVFFLHIPEEHFFMVGDNRDNSEDSRFWGTVDYSRIVGKPWITWLSITLTGSLESNAYEEKNRYKVRWQRMFKSVDYLEHNANIFDGECRYYGDSPCDLSRKSSAFY